MSRTLCLTSLVGAFLIGAGCSPSKPVDVSTHPPLRLAPPPQRAAGIKQKSDLTTHYAYHGDSHRDPFIPLTGRLTGGTGKGDLIIPQLSALVLKGIIGDHQKRVALIIGGGGVFVLKDGKLYDNRNRLIRGISGVVKERGVVLTGPDRSVRELALRQ